MGPPKVRREYPDQYYTDHMYGEWVTVVGDECRAGRAKVTRITKKKPRSNLRCGAWCLYQLKRYAVFFVGRSSERRSSRRGDGLTALRTVSVISRSRCSAAIIASACLVWNASAPACVTA